MPRAEIATRRAKCTLAKLHVEMAGKILGNEVEGDSFGPKTSEMLRVRDCPITMPATNSPSPIKDERFFALHN